MRTEVVMPQMGESVTEGTITKWLKEVGDKVARDEPLFELTTDKVDADVPSPVDGVLVEILAQVGETVEINVLVAVIDTEGKVGEQLVPSKPLSPKPLSPKPLSPKPLSPKPNGIGIKETKKVESAPIKQPMTELAKNQQIENRLSEITGDAAALRQTRSTPLVRRIAKEHGIASLQQISGTGLSGRVTKKDILSFIEQGGASAKGRVPVHAPNINIGPRDTVEMMSPQRQAIAKHMIASRVTSAHAQTIHEVDFSAVFKARDAQKSEFLARGTRLTFTAFLVKAVAEVLPEYPMINSALSGTNIVYRGDINIGVAVDTGKSLIVPVVKNADELSLLGIAKAIGDLAERARNRKLKPEDVQSGTFTVSNPGIFGSEFGIPIINQPQTAILVSGGIKKRVVVDQATDAIMVRPTSIFCLSFDHRVIDGATADRFMRRLREVIENWPIDG